MELFSEKVYAGEEYCITSTRGAVRRINKCVDLDRCIDVHSPSLQQFMSANCHYGFGQSRCDVAAKRRCRYVRQSGEQTVGPSQRRAGVNVTQSLRTSRQRHLATDGSINALSPPPILAALIVVKCRRRQSGFAELQGVHYSRS